MPEGLNAEIINASLVVKVRGPVAQMDAVTEDDITALGAFSNAEVGHAPYRVNLSFGEGFPNVGPLKTASVSAMVQAAEE